VWSGEVRGSGSAGCKAASTFRLKGRKGTSNIEKQWQIHMKNEIIEVSAKALIRINSAWLAITPFVATPHL